MKNNESNAYGKNEVLLDKNIEFFSERIFFKPTWFIESSEIVDIANDIDIAIAVGENFPFPYTLSDADSFKNFTLTAWANGVDYNFGILDKKSKRYMGNIGFKISLDGKVVENIGYWLGKDFHGRGFATEALQTVIEFIFVKFPKIESIKASVFDYNIASQKVLEKSGFVKTGEVTGPEVLRNGIAAKSIKYILVK